MSGKKTAGLLTALALVLFAGVEAKEGKEGKEGGRSKDAPEEGGRSKDAPGKTAGKSKGSAKVPGIEQLLANAEKTIKNTDDYAGRIMRTERLVTRMVRQLNAFKFKRPFRVYLDFIKPHAGREVIFQRGWNDDEIKVHKGSFPDITVNLDPRGSTAMEVNHHPITDFGFENTVRLIAVNLRRAIKRKEGEFEVSDGGEVFGRSVWKLEAEFPRGGRFVIAREDETLWDIAERTGQDMYFILYSNRDKDYEEPDDVDEGDKVFIPRYYGARAEFLFDKQHGLPLKISTYDRRGRLYERYEYPELELNTGLSDKDFDPDNPAYDF